ncbi:metallophosphoesterase family protein [Sphingobacterium psychroaquaticum]|uniref:Nuclease SbcCD subunit D n=1 Tax=Sphingobacterium psychroaquaticum TaxID=561061 RepID=A0A1X7IGI8_9SPHI|nr:exonuclease subunit SbcD [Sphingobacterium psychroaquaticum]SMG13400.1 Exodeoxyribonuclease I subunit D [Sphingobacterium psychroaquaticum]
MKILHTADWHLGKRLDYFSRLDEQRAVLEEICTIADLQQVDAVLVAGDLFDTFNPPVEAVELLYKTVRKLSKNGTRPVIAIAGNHDSADRIDAPDPLARECGIIFIGYPQAEIPLFQIEDGFTVTKSDKGFIEITLPAYHYPLRVLHTPFANELRLKQFLGLANKEQGLNEALQQNWKQIADRYCDKEGVNLLTAHLYMLKRGGQQVEEPEGEKPIKVGNADIVYSDGIPDAIQYTALGHLHRFQEMGGHRSPVVYASSPLAYSFSEAGQEKFVVLVDAKPAQQVKYTPILLTSGRPLCRMRFEDLDTAVSWLQENPNTLVELTLVSDEFISSQDLKRIHESHDGIIHIIPIVKQQQNDAQTRTKINLEQQVDQLFKDYFTYRLGQTPNAEIMTLLQEVMNSTNETEG